MRKMRQVIGLSLLMLIVSPLLWVIMLSVSKSYTFPTLMPEGLTSKHVVSVFMENNLFYQSLWTSIVIGLCTAFLGTVFGYMTARAFSRYLKVKYVKVLIIVSIPILIPSMVLFLGVHQVIQKNTIGQYYGRGGYSRPCNDMLALYIQYFF